MRKPKNANMQKGLKTLGNRKVKEYVPEALEYFKKCMELVRRPSGESNYSSKLKVDLEGLQKAVRLLPKNDREKIEKFWGLTGGPNHSKKLLRRDSKDIAYNEMANSAIVSLRKIFTLEYLMVYDSTVSFLIQKVNEKVNKDGITISESDVVKLLMAFFIYVDNGPKMSFEEDPMSIDTNLKATFWFDEYEVLAQMYKELNTYPDKSINIRLLLGFFETMDFKDMLSIKKSVGVEISNYFKNLQVITMNVGVETITDFKAEQVEVVRTVVDIRNLKERAFPYGAWDVVNGLILGKDENKAKLNEFFAKLSTIRNDWTKIANFKIGQKKLLTSNGVRTLNVYNIGGLQFTDIGEVMFLYSERNNICIKN